MSLLYITRIFHFAPALVLPALVLDAPERHNPLFFQSLLLYILLLNTWPLAASARKCRAFSRNMDTLSDT